MEHHQNITGTKCFKLKRDRKYIKVDNKVKTWTQQNYENNKNDKK